MNVASKFSALPVTGLSFAGAPDGWASFMMTASGACVGVTVNEGAAVTVSLGWGVAVFAEYCAAAVISGAEVG